MIGTAKRRRGPWPPARSCVAVLGSLLVVGVAGCGSEHTGEQVAAADGATTVPAASAAPDAAPSTPAVRPGTGFRRVPVADLPGLPRRDARSLPAQLGDPGARVAAYRSTASAVAGTFRPLIVTGDPPVLVLTLRGSMRMRTISRPGTRTPDATGPFAFRVYDAEGRSAVSIGLMTHVPDLR